MIKPWMIHRFFRIFNFFLTGACVVVLAGTAKILLTEKSARTFHNQEFQPAVRPVEKIEEKDYSFSQKLISESSPIVENIDTGIELKGILTYPDHNYAIVEYQGAQKLVKKEDWIGEWKIKEIKEDGLKINGNGKETVLKISRMMPEMMEASVPEKEVSEEISQNKNKALPENKISVDEEVFHKLVTNWADLFREAQMMPYVEKGESKGYVLCYLQPNSLMQKLGFRTGDIIEKINDREVTNLQTLMALYDFAEKGDCRVEIKRGPKRMQMVYQFNKNTV